jgi:hypothetical protein
MPADFGLDGTRIIGILNMDIALEQVNDREIGGGLALGHRGAL